MLENDRCAKESRPHRQVSRASAGERHDYHVRNDRASAAFLARQRRPCVREYQPSCVSPAVDRSGQASSLRHAGYREDVVLRPLEVREELVEHSNVRLETDLPIRRSPCT